MFGQLRHKLSKIHPKYFPYRKCGPRLSEGAAEKLKNRYVLMRNGAGEHERETGKKTAIPITVR